MMSGRGDPAAGAKTQILPVCKPARSQKSVQKVGIGSLEMPRGNAEERWR